ncbi:GNAT family N-acetyltransferase [Stenotrophomonas bentonitica]|uniref:GNAT family N-acetyltransferase n=1 Tax=Stenotrophomonas bentonitica TaxID=1450134 RepID=UPI00345E4E4D
MSSIRPFQTADIDACLAVFDSNVPQYFGSNERADFTTFLQQPQRQDDYLAVKQAGKIVACGGITLHAEGTAAFCWGMVRRDLHRHGMGTALTSARIAQALAAGATRVTLSTSQHTQAFYTARGFIVTGIVRDGHAPGIDAVDMQLTLR